MFNENSLFWVVAHPLFFLLVVACDAIPNEDFEVELAVYGYYACIYLLQLFSVMYIYSKSMV